MMESPSHTGFVTLGNETRHSTKPCITNHSPAEHDACPDIQSSGSLGGPIAAPQFPCWKRILDITCILITLPVSLIMMAGVALWIMFVSPGPLFYNQERVGYRAKRFVILKFRSMRVNAETKTHEGYLARLIHNDCPMTKLDARGDARLIPGGRILRALGLDELPQIFNILRGDMSLVGPRPCTPYEYHCYNSLARRRVQVPPGLTGLWQVSGKNKTTFDEMIRLDLEYSSRMSISLDLIILLKTLPAIATQVLESRFKLSSAQRIGRQI